MAVLNIAFKNRAADGTLSDVAVWNTIAKPMLKLRANSGMVVVSEDHVSQSHPVKTDYKQSSSMQFSTMDSGAVLASPSDKPENIAAKAANDVVAAYSGGGHYVNTIAGTAPAGSGTFMLLGSACDSVESGTGTVTIYDMCPACSSCDLVVAIREQVKYYARVLNAFKDASLYSSSTYATRYSLLKSACGTVPESCSASGYDLPANFLDPYKLLYQYAAAVQAWNYVVSTAGNKTVITEAPEENSGLVIRTSFSVPSCSISGNSLTCEISIDGVELQQCLSRVATEHDQRTSRGSVDVTGGVVTELLLRGYSEGASGSPLSVYVSPGVCSRKPYSDTVQGTSSVTKTSDSLGRRITYSLTVTKAGVYEVQVKFLPYIAMGFELCGRKAAKYYYDYDNLVDVPFISYKKPVPNSTEADTRTDYEQFAELSAKGPSGHYKGFRQKDSYRPYGEEIKSYVLDEDAFTDTAWYGQATSQTSLYPIYVRYQDLASASVEYSRYTTARKWPSTTVYTSDGQGVKSYSQNRFSIGVHWRYVNDTGNVSEYEESFYFAANRCRDYNDVITGLLTYENS